MGQTGRASEGYQYETAIETRCEMSIYKRGGIYWYKFMWQGKLIRESTKQGNDKVARNMESAHRTSLAKGEVGIREKKSAPILSEFLSQRFEPWAQARFERNVPKTWLWYRTAMRAILKYKPLASASLDEISSERISEFAAHRQSLKMQVSSVNNTLRALRRMLRLAVEWGALDVSPQIKMLPGERRRERVVTPEEESRYLAAASEPLARSLPCSPILGCGQKSASGCAGNQLLG
jgi:hypothetical protein